jgi:hypothetical protein
MPPDLYVGFTKATKTGSPALISVRVMQQEAEKQPIIIK